MKYKLIIDKNAEEEITAVVHSPSSLTQKIEDLIRSYSGDEGIMVQGDDLLRKLEDMQQIVSRIHGEILSV